MQPHINELGWARYLGGDGPLLQRVAFRRHLRRCADCRALRARLDRQQREWVPSLLEHPRLQRLLPDRPRFAWRPAAAAAATACAVLVGVVSFPRPAWVPKGKVTFVAYVKRGDTVERLGERCAPGDRVRFRYESQLPFLLILERDARTVSTLVPAAGAESIRLPLSSGDTQGSWALDDTPGREDFYGLFSATPLSVNVARAAIGAAGDGPVELPGTEVIHVRCFKESR